jgi:hypothetical protein
MDFKPTGSPIDETMYPSIKMKELSSKDIQDLTDLFSGKIKCVKVEPKTKDNIIDAIDYEKEMWMWHEYFDGELANLRKKKEEDET